MHFQVGLAEQAVHGQDRALADPRHGLFGVFDGLGGVPGSEHAAELARECLARMGASPELAPMDSLVEAMVSADRQIVDSQAGATTAVVARIEGLQLHYLAIGDSRLYLKRPATALLQLTSDQGEANLVDNCLGIPTRSPEALTRQRGTVQLAEGDKLLLLTDGITGDFDPDILSRQELERAIRGEDPQAAAERLIEVARKRDDRTALVVFVGAEPGFADRSGRASLSAPGTPRTRECEAQETSMRSI